MLLLILSILLRQTLAQLCSLHQGKAVVGVEVAVALEEAVLPGEVSEVGAVEAGEAEKQGFLPLF